MRDRSQIARLLRDLDEIKVAVKRNRTVLRELVVTPIFRWLIPGFGAAVLVLAALFQYLIGLYGSYAAIPTPVLGAIWTCSAAALAAFSAAKIIGISLAIKKIDPELSRWKLFTTQYAGVAHISVPLLVITVGASIHFARAGQALPIVGICGIYYGIIANALASAVSMSEYLVYGYWLMASASACFFFPGIPATVWAVIVFTGGSAAFAVSTAIVKVLGRGPGSRDE